MRNDEMSIREFLNQKEIKNFWRVCSNDGQMIGFQDERKNQRLVIDDKGNQNIPHSLK
ncbi:MAG: hypothetical protein ABEK17_00935 [Candidatus Aenigmatarchaeota archaeon]